MIVIIMQIQTKSYSICAYNNQQKYNPTLLIMIIKSSVVLTRSRYECSLSILTCKLDWKEPNLHLYCYVLFVFVFSGWFEVTRYLQNISNI